MYLDPEHLEDISPGGSLTRLQVVKLHTFWDASPIVAFQKAPVLREVELFGLDATKVSLPWAQLSSLSLHTSNHEQCDVYAMLQQTPNLERLHLRISAGILPSESAILGIRLERLRHLTFHCQWSSDDRRTAITFANLLTVPALVDLTTDIDEKHEFANALRNMLTRSRRGEEMRSLTLKLLGNYHDTGYIDHILGGLARLDLLTVAEVGWNQLGPVFDLLGRPPQLTEVRELSIELASGHSTYSNLAWIVSELQEDQSDFRRLRFSIPPELQVNQRAGDKAKILAALERLRRVAGGAKISIKFWARSDSVATVIALN
ncbi:hypothetical protein C8F01DRAFT_1165379, partial [Mycena amicta]